MTTTKVLQAIDASLVCDWDLAIDLNLQILNETPSDIPTLNRLAKCYAQIGDKKSAKDAYQKVLDLDKYNTVALKNIKLLSLTPTHTSRELCQENFIETPGVTKTATLIKLADKLVLANLVCKQQLVFKPKARLVSITTQEGIYIGSLPDDLSLKLKRLLSEHYTYQVSLKSASNNTVSIFIRELKRPPKKATVQSFGRSHLKFV